MRKWIVEETGEVRPPLNRENFLSATNKISLAYYNFNELERFPILRVTEITDIRCVEIMRDVWATLVDDKVPSFDEWNW